MASYKKNIYDNGTSAVPPYRNCSNTAAYTSQQMMPALPTGIPTGYTSGQQPGVMAVPMPMQVPGLQQVPPTVESTMYTPGVLRSQIGKRMRVEFLIGTTGPLVDRTGTLITVGASYILLQPFDSPNIIYCDIYSIKFITILQF